MLMKPPMKRVHADAPGCRATRPVSLMRLLTSSAPLFTAPSFRTFCGLACSFFAQTGKRTVCGMLGALVTIAIDDTLFKRRGKKVWAAAWCHDGSAPGPARPGPRKTGRGNNRVIAAIVVRLPFLNRPVALARLAKPVIKGTNSASRLRACPGQARGPQGLRWPGPGRQETQVNWRSIVRRNGEITRISYELVFRTFGTAGHRCVELIFG